jgi:hypothetical protein
MQEDNVQKGSKDGGDMEFSTGLKGQPGGQKGKTTMHTNPAQLNEIEDDMSQMENIDEVDEADDI